MKGVCKLCDTKNVILSESHIIPSYVYSVLKKSGAGRAYLRLAENINKPVQDGDKPHMLCKTCDNKFSNSENIFKNNIFIPYINQLSLSPIERNHFIYYCISVAWRTYIHHAEIIDTSTKYDLRFSGGIRDAAKIWKLYLKRSSVSHASPISIFIINKPSAITYQDRYPFRITEATPFQNHLDKDSGIFINLMGIIIIVHIEYNPARYLSFSIENFDHTKSFIYSQLPVETQRLLSGRKKETEVVYNTMSATQKLKDYYYVFQR